MMKDNEFYQGADEIWDIQDENITLKEADSVTIAPPEDDDEVPRKKHNKREKLQQKLSSFLIGAVAVVILASTVNASSYICPICSYENCEYWNNTYEYEYVKLSLKDEERTMFTSRTTDPYQMGVFFDESDKLEDISNRRRRLPDGRNYFLHVSTHMFEDAFTYDYWMHTSVGDYGEDEGVNKICQVTYGLLGEKSTIQEIRPHTVVQLLEMEEGKIPANEVISEIGTTHEMLLLSNTAVKCVDEAGNLWIRVASNVADMDVTAIMDGCQLVFLEQDIYDLGQTMCFYDLDNTERIFQDQQYGNMTNGNSVLDKLMQEDFRQIRYAVDVGRYAGYISFAECSYDHISEKWIELNEKLQERNHLMMPVYRLSDIEWNNITYYVYLYDSYSILEENFELRLVPEQESNCALTYTVPEILLSPENLDESTVLADILSEDYLKELENFLSCVYLRGDKPEILDENTDVQNEEVETVEEVSLIDERLVWDPNHYKYNLANDNIVVIRDGYVCGLADVMGNIIIPPRYSGYWAVNDNGYVAFYDDELNAIIVDQNGNVLFTIDGRIEELAFGENNTIMVKIHNLFENQGAILGPNTRIIYYNIDGSIIYDSGLYYDNGDSYQSSHATAFANGEAYFYRNDCGDAEVLNSPTYRNMYKITIDSTTTLIGTEDPFNDYTANKPQDHISDGYMVVVGKANQSWNGYRLYDTATGEISDALFVVDGTLIPDYIPAENSSFSSLWKETDIPVSYSLESYIENGARYMHYGTRGVTNVNYNENYSSRKQILFDFNDISDMRLQRILAIHDDILFNDYKYLAANDGDEWFYIDLDGKVVSETYDMVSSFNNEGYAMVIREDIAYLINDRFEVLDEVDGIYADQVSLVGNRFTVNGIIKSDVEQQGLIHPLYLYLHDME